jgi:hypothetical protein
MRFGPTFASFLDGICVLGPNKDNLFAMPEWYRYGEREEVTV